MSEIPDDPFDPVANINAGLRYFQERNGLPITEPLTREQITGSISTVYPQLHP